MALGPKSMHGRLLVRRPPTSLMVLLSLGTLVEMIMLLTGVLDACPPGMTWEELNRRPYRQWLTNTVPNLIAWFLLSLLLRVVTRWLNILVAIRLLLVSLV